MGSDRVSNLRPLTYESDALPTALRDHALSHDGGYSATLIKNSSNLYFYLFSILITKTNRKQNWAFIQVYI